MHIQIHENLGLGLVIFIEFVKLLMLKVYTWNFYLIDEQIVMTTKNKTEKSTTIAMERRRVDSVDANKVHIAGGNHTGIIINKQITNGAGKKMLV